jgi:threonine/homoserine/homoserine lactone efflux protein
MTGIEMLAKGLLAGLAIAAPVGPVNVLCASRTIAKGRVSGLISGLGAATADALYGSVAGFSLTFVIDFLQREEFWIRCIGGILLVAIGGYYLVKPPRPLQAQDQGEASGADFSSTQLLTLTNPTTVLSFLAVLVALGAGQHHARWLTLLLVLGIFLGSMLWWVVLVAVVNWLRDRFNNRTLLWMNRIAGVAIGVFGVLTFVLGLSHRR